MQKKETFKRHNITLETKLDIIKRFGNGETKAQIGRKLGYSESTIRSILNKAEAYQDKGKISSTSQNMQNTRNRSNLMIEMEDLLYIWMEDCKQRGIPINSNNIKVKALSIFSTLKNEKHKGDSSTFQASKGWFENFKTRAGLRNVKLSGETTSAVNDSVVKFTDELKKIIEENGYQLGQIFNADEIGLFWKKMPARTSLSESGAATPGQKASTDRLTILLGGNAEGDCKLKPMVVCQTLNPWALKGCKTESFPVIWESNKKAWMTRQLFEEWFTSHFCPTVEKYCQEKNLDFKALLILDNAPGHPTTLNVLNSNVKVIYLPPSSTSLLQPMDQGINATFQAYYLRRIFATAMIATTGTNPVTLEEFWEKYDIKHAVDNIHKSWDDVSESCMKAVWQTLFPECANDFCNFDWYVNTIIEEIAEIGTELGFEADPEDIRELLESHSKALTDDDLLAIDCERACEEEIKVEAPPKEMPPERIAELFKAIEKAKEIIIEFDPNEERGINVRRGIDKQVECYRKIMEDKKNVEDRQNMEDRKPVRLHAPKQMHLLAQNKI